MGLILIYSGLSGVMTSDISGKIFPTETPTLIPTRIPTHTQSPTITSIPTSTATRTFTSTATQIPSKTFTSTATLTPSLTSTFTPSITLPSVLGSDCINRDYFEIGKVISVIDGDTIKVELNGETVSVRLVGIDAPEIGTKIEYYGPQSKSFLELLLLNKTVTMFKDKSEKDSFDRLLRYVIVGNTFVNYEMIRKGYTVAVNYYPDIACEIPFSDAQKQAINSQLGIWYPTPIPNTERMATIPPVIVAPSNCDPSYPGVCIPPPPPDLDCGQISYRRFVVLPPDPHNFDGDLDGIGCEN